MSSDTKTTLRVRLLTAIAGGNEGGLMPGGFVFPEGKVVDIPTVLAEKWCAGGIAMAAPFMKTEDEVKRFRMGL
jgi:hypothetical protein